MLIDAGGPALARLVRYRAAVVYAGLDLSSTIDLTALVLLFPSEDDTFDVLPFFWMPSENIRKRELQDRVPYSLWVKQKFMEATEGNVIDIRAIKEKIAWARKLFQLRELAYDPWNANQLATELGEEGVTCVPIRQEIRHSPRR